MKMIEALKVLKGKGITNLTGMYNQGDINVYLENAREGDKNAADVLSRYPDMSWVIYHMDHEDNHYIAEINGHYIIATQYDNFDMATYGDYGKDEEMYSDFKEYTIAKQAKVIADQKVNEGSEMPHIAWMMVATHELRLADIASSAAFEREYGHSNER
jgi:hypothetical protein